VLLGDGARGIREFKELILEMMDDPGDARESKTFEEVILSLA
jgi:hypothetical protein